MEIFALVTGIVYMVLEIKQSTWMWVVGIISGAAAVAVFWNQQLYANMGLNIYYVLVSFWGIYAWRRDSCLLRESEGSDADIHLNRLSKSSALVSLTLFVVGTAVLIAFLHRLGGQMSALDAAVTVLSAIATWWLSRSYKEQWLLWILADTMATMLCAFSALQGDSGMWWMSALYFAYTASAVYGFSSWIRRGKYLDKQ